MSDGKLIDGEGKSSLDRPLIAYAFLAQTTRDASDLMSGLAPIFKPVAKQLQGKTFNSEEFAGLVEQIYGIRIHPWAVDDLASRLEACGILVRVSLSESAQAFNYVYAEVSDGPDEVSEGEIRALLLSFTQYAAGLLAEHKIKMVEAELEQAFLDHLVLTDFSSIRSRKPQETKGPRTLSLPKSQEELAAESEATKRSRIDVICASYILDAFEKNKAAYELIVRVAHGALLAEVVLNVQNPGSTVSLRSLAIVLDGPLAMSVLDLREPESTAYARAFVNELTARGASIKIFDHSIDEIENNLRSVVDAVARGAGHGATARRLMMKNSFRVYVESIKPDIRSALDRLGVKSVECPTTTQYLQELSTDDEEEFCSMLGFYTSAQAQHRDASSISGVIRLRRKARTPFKTFQNAMYLFVTENNRVAEKASRFVVAKRLNLASEVPPALTDRFLAGLMWVTFGGKTDALTHHRLLANCVAALEPRSDLMSKVHQFLAELDEPKANHFRALMTDERAGQHFTQMTLGDPVLVTSSNDASELLIAIEKRMTEEHRLEFEKREIEQREEHRLRVGELEAKMASDRAEADRRAQEVAAAGIQRELDIERLQANMDHAARERKAELRRDIARQQRLIEAAVVVALGSERRAKRLIYTIVLVALLVVTAVPLSFDLAGYQWLIFSLAAVGAILNAIGFWELPNRLLAPLARKKRQSVFEAKIDEYGVSNSLEAFAIDWGSAEVCFIPDPPSTPVASRPVPGTHP